MAATKKIRVDRTYSTDNATDATARNLLTFSAGTAGFNASTGVISIPTNTNQLTNGAGFLTSSDISGKQNTLVSGTNIKTINGNSILGSGDLSISGGGGVPTYNYNDTVGLGYQTGTGIGRILLGNLAGNGGGDSYSIAIGHIAGQANQGGASIAIGQGAGYYNQGNYSIAIGYNAGNNYQNPNSIVLNASGNTLDTNQSGFFVKPVRSDATPTNIIYYNSTTGEMTYGAAPSGSGGSGGGGGGGASAVDYFSFQNPSPGGQTSFTFTLPAASGPVFASIYQGPGVNILSIGPSMWVTPWSAGMFYGGPSNYLSTSPSGTQTVQLDMSSYSSVSVTLFVLETADANYQNFFNPGNSQANTGTVSIFGPVQQNLVSWTTTGYAYGVLVPSSQDVWTSLSAIVPSANVTTYVDSAHQLVFFRCPASVWNASYSVILGTMTPVMSNGGPPASVYTQVWFFGM